MDHLIEVTDLHKTFVNHHRKSTLQALDGVSFSVPEGHFLGVVGPSGSGKSTIIKSIYRTYLVTGGAIWYQSETFGPIDIARATPRQVIALRKKEIGYVSQFLAVMPRTTSLELVTQSLLEMGTPQSEAREAAVDALRHFGLAEELWDSYPNTFSGGEKLRLNIAKAIVKKPRLLLLDEPTASLDENNKRKVREAISRLKAGGTTMIGIFHDLAFMEGLCDAVYDMHENCVRPGTKEMVMG